MQNLPKPRNPVSCRPNEVEPEPREIHWIQERSQPPKPGRHGERQPTYHGIDPTHCRWLRQARRFRNLAKLLQKPQLHPSQQQHATRLWYSITKAPGFNSGFVGWWNHQHGHRAAITFHTPTPSRAAVVADGCLDQYEQALLRTRVNEAKQKRKDNVNLIFRDLKKEAPLPCTSLLHTARAVVKECDPEMRSLVVEPP